MFGITPTAHILNFPILPFVDPERSELGNPSAEGRVKIVKFLIVLKLGLDSEIAIFPIQIINMINCYLSPFYAVLGLLKARLLCR